MAANDGTSSRPARVRHWAVIALVLLLALWWASRWMAGRVVVHHVEVAGIARAAGASPARQAATAAEGIEEAPEKMATSTVDIWLRKIRLGPWMWQVPSNIIGQFPVDHPEWNQALLGSYETFEQLAITTVPGKAWVGLVPDRLMDLAEQEGFYELRPEDATPEEALIAMQVEWFRSVSEFHEATKAFYDEHLPEGETYASIGARERERLSDPALGRQERDVTGIEAWTGPVIERWPDHPVAEFARLAQVQVLAWGMWTDTPDRRGIHALLEQMEDPAAREQAALALTSVSRRYLGDDTLDALADIQGLSPKTEMLIAAHGMMQATRWRRWERAVAWSSRFERAWEASCGIDPDDIHFSCGDRTHELLDTNARLIALGHKSPSTWKEALVSQAWSCHLQSPHEGRSHVEVAYEGDGWVYGTWDQETDVTRCLQAATHLEVMPDEPVLVKLAVHDEDPWAWAN